MPAVAGRFDWEMVQTPLAGAAEPTDAGLVVEARDGVTVILVDGHGQGTEAVRCVRAALGLARAHQGEPPAALFGRVHARLAETSGASLVLARVSARLERLEFSGVGRIHGWLQSPTGTIDLVSAPGVVGIGARVLPHCVIHSWTADSTLVLAADGLVDRWESSLPAGPAFRSAASVAQALLRGFARPPDDVSLVVLRAR
jgi:hypothetical protein